MNAPLASASRQYHQEMTAPGHMCSNGPSRFPPNPAQGAPHSSLFPLPFVPTPSTTIFSRAGWELSSFGYTMKGQNRGVGQGAVLTLLVQRVAAPRGLSYRPGNKYGVYFLTAEGKLTGVSMLKENWNCMSLRT